MRERKREKEMTATKSKKIFRKKISFFFLLLLFYIVRAFARAALVALMLEPLCAAVWCRVYRHCVECSGRNQFVLHKNKVHLRLAVSFFGFFCFVLFLSDVKNKRRLLPVRSHFAAPFFFSSLLFNSFFSFHFYLLLLF